MSNFKKSDLKAPRFRNKSMTLLNKKTFKEFIEKYPKYINMDINMFKEIISTFNGNLWQGVIDNRDGIELPESLGYIFIGSCDKPDKINPNYKLSIKNDKLINHKNWVSDDYLAKIFYSNYTLKYRFKDRELWKFVPVRQFKRMVSKTYPELYTKYIYINKELKISNLIKNK